MRVVGSDEVVVPFGIYKSEVQEDGSLLVYGKAAGDDLDLDDQILDKEFLARSMGEWFENWGNIRQQHSTNLPPAGKAMEMDVRDDGIYVKGRIVEPTAKELVKAGVYQAYSVGISKPRIVRDLKAKNGRVIDGITSEISLVDYPANPTCKMALCKRLKSGEIDDTPRYVFSGIEVPHEKLNPDIVADAVSLLTKMYGQKEIMEKGAKTTTPGKKPAPLPAEPGAASVSGNVGDEQVMKQKPPFLPPKDDDSSDDDDKPDDDDSDSGGKKPFPGAAPPFGGKKKAKKAQKKAKIKLKIDPPDDSDDGDDKDDGDDGDDGDDADKTAKPSAKKGNKKPKAPAQAASDEPEGNVAPEAMVKAQACPMCGGSGTVTDGADCPKCGGNGKMKKAQKIFKGLMGNESSTDDTPFFLRRYHDALCPGVTDKRFAKLYGEEPVKIIQDGDFIVYNALQKAIKADRGTGQYFQIIASLTDAYGCAKSLAQLDPNNLLKALQGWSGLGTNAPDGIPSAKTAKESVTPRQYTRSGNIGGQQRRSPGEGRGGGDSGARIPSTGNAISPEQFGRSGAVSGQERPSPGDVKKGSAGPPAYADARANQARSALQSLHDHLSWTWPDMCPLGHAMSDNGLTGNQDTGKIGIGRIDMKDMSTPQPVPAGRIGNAEGNVGVPGRITKAFGASDGAPVLQKMAQLEDRVKKYKKTNVKLQKQLTKMASGPDTRRAPVRGALFDPMAILKGKPQTESNGDGRKRDLKDYLEALAGAGSAQLSPSAANMLNDLD